MKSPFPLAPYKGKKAIVHIVQKEREGGMRGERGEEDGEGEDAKTSPYPPLFFMFPPCCSALHGCRPTCDITYINTGSCFCFVVFFSSLFGKEGGRERGRD